MLRVKNYIESGILELYVMGAASDEETEELFYMREKYAQVREALWNLEIDMESVAQKMAVIPPAGILEKIEAEINSLVQIPDPDYLKVDKSSGYNSHSKRRKDFQFIEIEVASRQIRVHKLWAWAFAFLFLLLTFFLASAIYFYNKDNHIEKQVKQLKMELEKQRKR